jgi:hypothetical protein
MAELPTVLFYKKKTMYTITSRIRYIPNVKNECVRIYESKKRIHTNALINAAINPTIKMRTLSAPDASNSSRLLKISRAVAAKMVGTARRNEKSTMAFFDNPIRRPATMVE